MEDNLFTVNSNANEEFHGNVNNGVTDDGWDEVSYAKRRRRPVKPSQATSIPNKIGSDRAGCNGNNAFRYLEQPVKVRRRRTVKVKAEKTTDVSDKNSPVKSQIRSPGDDKKPDASIPKTEKPKRAKKPMVSVAEAAANIDADILSTILAILSFFLKAHPEYQLERFTYHFQRAFAEVEASQFPWLKMFKEASVPNLTDIPLGHLSEDVCEVSAKWVRKFPLEPLSLFVMKSVDNVLAELPFRQSRSQVAIFVVLAIILRSKPDVMINLLPKLMENPKYKGLDERYLVLWMTLQVTRGDRAVGLYVWWHFFFPMLSAFWRDSGSRDLVWKIVDRFLYAPKGGPSHQDKQSHSENMDCWKQGDEVNVDNIEATLVVLKQLSEEWKQIGVNLLPSYPFWETLKTLWSRMKMCWLKVSMILNVQSFTRQTDMVR